MQAKKLNMLVIAGALVLLSGCIPSVNPLYTDNDLVFDPLLVGVWVEERPARATDENWAFEKEAGKSYRLTITEEHGEKGEFEAHLLKLNDYFFLDLRPSQVELDAQQAELTKWALIPGHLIFRVHELDSELKLSGLVSDWLDGYLRKNPNALAHVTGFPLASFDPPSARRNVQFVTASTQDLQQFVLAHVGENELFGEPGVYVRRPAGAR
jgi:hypothetical protein